MILQGVEMHASVSVCTGEWECAHARKRARMCPNVCVPLCDHAGLGVNVLAHVPFLSVCLST